MNLTDEELKDLVELIKSKIVANFSDKHMSKNLVNTIQIEQTQDSIRVIIPAQTYNMLLFQQKGVIVHTSHGSYASKLNDEGSSFYVYPQEGTRKGSYRINPRNHIGFADNAVNEAIDEWFSGKSDKYVIQSKKEV